MRKVLLTAIGLCIGSLVAKSQTVMEYKPIPLTPNSNTDVDKNDKAPETVSDAYYLDSRTNKFVKIKIKYISNKYGIFITASKKLTDYSWFPTTAMQATKLTAYSSMADYFEFQVYMPIYQKTIYF